MATNVELQTFDQQEMVGICGRNDEFLRIVRSAFDCTLVARGNSITVSGPEEQCQQLQLLLQELLFLYRQGLPLTTHDVRYSIFMVKEGKLDSLHRMYADTIIVNNRGRQVKAKTLGQWQYVETIRKNFITPIPGTLLKILAASFRPLALPPGKSIWVISPVITILLPKPKRVKNIFICSGVVF